MNTARLSEAHSTTLGAVVTRLRYESVACRWQCLAWRRRRCWQDQRQEEHQSSTHKMNRCDSVMKTRRDRPSVHLLPSNYVSSGLISGEHCHPRTALHNSLTGCARTTDRVLQTLQQTLVILTVLREGVAGADRCRLRGWPCVHHPWVMTQLRHWPS